ncbi:hypothetical protein BDV95DRAFT_478877 [Massariosphaeria phaeospora]|uniref:Tat pathway signal sequence n=1 Tax=Massariosphaeria phaeospora TaxID=100035 RepID=A0A7C8ML45_9PLEO|nr:hypothetical protein BDV95DRAFT_478877 [Massariosphaeria phaeospora]
MFSRLFTKTPFKKAPQDEDEDSEALLSCSLSSAPQQLDKDRAHDELRIAVRAVFVCTVIYIAIGIAIGLSFKSGEFVTNPDEFCINHISRYSPLVGEVKPSWKIVQFNGSFLHENIYRQTAGPEVDAAWEALGVEYRSVIVPESEAERSGLRPDQVKRSEYYGGGYPANVEGLHHLHCLNLLRKALKWNYDYYLEKQEGAFKNAEYVVRYHVTHCLDILRQQLMCVPDVGVLGQVWWQPESGEHPTPFVDFNTKHQCRDYEAIRVWAEAHQLPPESEVDMNRFYEVPNPSDVVYSEIP